jgi:type I restriction enzyme S subunit
MNKDSVPSDWTICKLGDVSRIRYGLGQPPEFDVHGIPMIRATDVKNGKINNSVIKVKREAIPQGKNPFLEYGDILVVRSGAYTGDAAMYDGRWKTAIAGYDLVVSPDITRIDPSYLSICLLGNSVQKYFRSQRHRSAQPHLNSKQLSDALIPLPSIPEQHAIARSLRAVQVAREARLRELALERERKAALMEHLFRHGTRGEPTKQTEIGEMPENWEIVSLGDVIIDGPQMVFISPLNFTEKVHQ